MRAVEDFNAAFGFALPEPLGPEPLRAMAEFAQLRGRRTLAEQLRAEARGLETPAPAAALTAAEHHAFPKGRWT